MFVFRLIVNLSGFGRVSLPVSFLRQLPLDLFAFLEVWGRALLNVHLCLWGADVFLLMKLMDDILLFLSGLLLVFYF